MSVLPTIDLPTYTVKLPVSEQTIKFRPYMVKEQKILAMAKESGDMMATQRYTELAKQAALRREAERRAGSVGKPDVGAMGLPAQGSSNPYGTGRPDPLGIR